MLFPQKIPNIISDFQAQMYFSILAGFFLPCDWNLKLNSWKQIRSDVQVGSATVQVRSVHNPSLDRNPFCSLHVNFMHWGGSSVHESFTSGEKICSPQHHWQCCVRNLRARSGSMSTTGSFCFRVQSNSPSFQKYFSEGEFLLDEAKKTGVYKDPYRNNPSVLLLDKQNQEYNEALFRHVDEKLGGERPLFLDFRPYGYVPLSSGDGEELPDGNLQSRKFECFFMESIPLDFFFFLISKFI